MTVDLQIGRFVSAFNMIGGWTQAVIGLPPNASVQFDHRAFSEMKERVAFLVEISDLCDFAVINVCAKEAAKELDLVQDTRSVPGRLSVSPEQSIRLRGTLSRLKDGVIAETQTRFALILDHRSKEWWEPRSAPFGDDFKNGFARSEYELDEACKCLAVGRSTAAVFHLLRIMESALRAVHGCLGLPPPFSDNDRNWGNILRAINDEIGKRPKSWPEKDLFREMYALLAAVKDAWRNPTMHIETKYNPEEASDIFNAVRGFMKKLASRMDEDGSPKA